MNATFDRSNSEQVNAFNMITKTNRSFYLTGRAGTGKTTFLRYVQEKVDNKRFVTLAPTGVAAYNAHGQTIHSFFGFSFGPQVPGEFPRIREEKRKIMNNIDAIIIDEVSMVRCDIVDAMDRVLRMVRKSSEPFGGLQMIFVGDMFQLEPITLQEDRNILRRFYKDDCYYFYKASVIQRYSLPKIEFKRIYRQRDPVFIDMLEHVRKGCVTALDLQKLNSRYVFEDERNPKMKITLTTTNRMAEEINDTKLNQLEGEEKTYTAIIQGDIKSCAGVAQETLTLKVGAQVMLTRNDLERRWVNGTLATVESMDDEKVKVRLDNGSTYEITTVKWDSIEYKYNNDTKELEQEIVGYIIQMPLKLAWAITIHKSQSLTFDRVAIDLGAGAFSNGQTYVALSRCRTLEGLELLTPISAHSVKVSNDVINFASDFNDNETIERELNIGEAMDTTNGYTDYDKAAISLYNMAAQESIKCNYKNAKEYMKQALACVVDDECLQGFEWLSFQSDNMDNQILNATGLYYDGRKGEAEFILSSYGNAIDDNLDALYILSRCYEDKEDWEAVESIYMKMLAIQERFFETGQDSPSFRKMRYRLAILNEKVFGDPGAGLMRQLITENPGYDKYHNAIRWMLANNEDATEEADNEDDSNYLVKMLFDKTIDDSEYMTKIKEERENKTQAWSEYRSFIKNIGLTMPY